MLARTWFHRSPQWVLENHSAAELAEMQAEYELSPWDEKRTDMQGAMICAAVRTAAGEKSVTFSDWIYKFDDEPEPAPSLAAVMSQARTLIGEDRFERKS